MRLTSLDLFHLFTLCSIKQCLHDDRSPDVLAGVTQMHQRDCFECLVLNEELPGEYFVPLTTDALKTPFRMYFLKLFWNQTISSVYGLPCATLNNARGLIFEFDLGLNKAKRFAVILLEELRILWVFWKQFNWMLDTRRRILTARDLKKNMTEVLSQKWTSHD